VSQLLKQRFEHLTELLDELALEAQKGVPIIVEGKKDENALKDLAVVGTIIPVKAYRRALVDVVCEIEQRGYDEVILMLDFDRRGREWTKRLVGHFERAKVKPNLRFWREIYKVAGRELKDIEGLTTYLKNLKRRIGNS